MLLNIIGFQIGWFACVLGAAYGYPLLGPLVALPVIGLHLMRQADRSPELALMCLVALIGSTYDQTLMWFDLVNYSASLWSLDWLPIWMITLWLLFATTLNVSLKWLQDRYLLAAVFGFIGGPLAYWGGAKLGAIHWLRHDELLLALAIGWAVLMPILVWLAAHFNCYARKENPGV
jgi:hypothetical protein